VETDLRQFRLHAADRRFERGVLAGDEVFWGHG
jgi:hypothetical protein